jgi:peptidoglycan/xylan/chitin deacetylase (PgdA/CDA1 family)
VSHAAGLAGIAIDVDSVATHLAGYGVHDCADTSSSYQIAIPRALALLEGLGAKATFFLVAAEASREPDAVRRIVAAGHEVGCHSMTHTLPFDVSTPEAAHRELLEARDLLGSLAGEPVEGFRAPSWGVARGLLEGLRAAGYRYDASAFPSWMLALVRLAVARRGAPDAPAPKTHLADLLLARAAPHALRDPRGDLAEVPVSTVPLLRVPCYHTLGLLLPPWAFRALLAGVRLRRGSLSYTLHAADFLDTDADGLDPRIRRHPGMDLPLARKLPVVKDALAALGRGRSLVPLRTIAREVLAR